PAVPPARLPRVAPTREARTARVALVLIPTVLVLLAVTTRLVVTSERFSRAVATQLATELARRTSSAVQLQGVTFGWDLAPCFQNFEIYRFSGAYKLKATTRQACIEHWASAVGSGFHAIRLKLEQPAIQLEGQPGQEAARLPSLSETRSSTASRAKKKAALREIQVVFDDLQVDWSAVPLPERFAAGTFGPIDGTVTVQVRGGKTAATLAIREPKSGTEIQGRVNPTPEGWDMSAGIEGDLVSVFGQLLTAAGLDIRKMPTRGTIGALYDSKRRDATIDVDLEQHDLDVANELVSTNRLVGFTARERARFQIDIDRGEIGVKDGLLEVNGVPVTLSLKVAPGEGSPTFDLQTDLRTTPLLKLLRSVPGAAEPVLTKELSPDVSFALSFSLTGKLRDPSTWSPKLDYRLTGLGPKGEGSGLELLKSTFRYYPLTREGRSSQGRLMGPGSPNWVPFARIPYLQRRSVVVSEDSGFFYHRGIELTEMQDAIRKGMTSDEKTRGGSTITQQLVKNLFLTRDRTALRKVQELLLTLHLEASLSKEEIFELYMNIIEWGPDIYGLKEAADHYFGKKPEYLSIREMAYLATIIPGPLLYHKHYEDGYVTARHNGKVDALLERLAKVGNLTDEQLADAKAARIYFVRRKKEPPKEPPPAGAEEEEPEPER
ncbi:transglycosylase domain-containing protein, partial [Myxococcota bacterium]|nr:transglycosylase domain-containing protein [Myxococcota bacterium]